MAIDFEATTETLANGGEQPELSDAEAVSGINITPLIDVLLVLLVMLIITIPVQFHAVRVELPNGGPAPTSAPPVVVRIAVTSTQQVLWNGELLAGRQELDARLQSAALLPNPPEIHIHAEATSKYETVAAVLSAAQSMGLQKIGVVGLDEYSVP